MTGRLDAPVWVSRGLARRPAVTNDNATYSEHPPGSVRPSRLLDRLLVDASSSGPPVVFGAGILDRAVLATDVSFTLVDARLPDQPLAWVNPAFLAMTGYTFEESVGRNCRFLQGPDTDRIVVARIEAALVQRRPVSVTLLNHRKDGSAFWNDLTINPVLDSDGQLTHFVGMQIDVTSRIEADTARERALLAEHDAAVRATAAQAALALLAEASNQLAHSLDVDDSLRRLAALVVPALADWVVIHRVESDGSFSTSPVVRHRDGRTELTRRYAELLPSAASEQDPLNSLIETGRGGMAADVDRDASARVAGTELAAIRDRLGAGSTMFVALPGRNGVVGTMELNRGHENSGFTEGDYDLALDLGRRVGLAVENARLYQNERQVAETLQRSLLPTLPCIQNLEIAARYNAAQDGVQVGGDFYDVLALPTGRTAIVVGDVEGHDLSAAAAMGHLRGLIQAVLFDASAGDEADSPDSVLRRVDRLVQRLGTIPMASVVYAELAPSLLGQTRLLRYASAGHPPLLVRQPDGSARFLSGEAGLILGVGVADRIVSEELLAPGSTLLAFTDGLVERRGADIDDGMELLRLLVERAPADINPDDLCERLLEWLGDGEDDTALLAVRTW
jgi:PAS domain S-box-containing protein